MEQPNSIAAYLVAAGQYHDIDFARLELLRLLAEEQRIRVTVASDYHDIDAISRSEFLLTYTCNLLPSEDEQRGLRDYIERGGKWFALHGTNSILEFIAQGVNSPETAPLLMETLGTQFIAHPPIEPFVVRTADPEHPLVRNVGEFMATDELYLSRIHGDLHELLFAEFSGEATGFVEKDWHDNEHRPVYYINRVGAGEVLYLNLGHCRGHYDMKPVMDYYPKIERGSWDTPQYYELLRRGIRYCANIN